ncbi:MAG: outer membrane lipoprotein-sorting protein [Bacteroidota bacterium]
MYSRNVRLTFLFFTLFWLVFLPTDPATGQSATEILEQMEQKMRGDASYAEMTMTIVRPAYEREVAMRAWALGDDYSLIQITSPARDRGTVFLKRENDIWNYIPSIDRTIKLPPSMMSQSWMGSDFSNDDLVRESSTLNDFEHDLNGEEIWNDRPVWVIDLTPKPGTPIVWGRVRMWIDREESIQWKIEQFNQRDELVNTLEMSDLTDLGGRRLPARMELTPADKPGHQTVMTYRALDFSTDLNPDFFTLQRIQQLR